MDTFGGLISKKYFTCLRSNGVEYRRLIGPLVVVLCFTVYVIATSIPPVFYRTEILSRNSCDITPGRKLLVVAYYRGGSSFLGELFNRNPSALYWFEPIHQMALNYLSKHKHSHEDPFVYRYNNETIIQLSEDFADAERDTIFKLLNCQFSAIKDSDVITEEFALKPIELRKLLQRTGCRTLPWQSTLNFLEPRCLLRLQQMCSVVDLRVIKVIRMGLYTVEPLLRKDPELRVILYVRDPRGILHSRKYLFHYLINIKYIRLLCHRMDEDYRHLKHLQQRYPGRVKLYRYEDLAAKPEAVARDIYQFAGQPLSNMVNQWIKKNTQTKPWLVLPYTTGRDSDATANKWRGTLQNQTNKLVLKYCGASLAHFGYTV